MIPLYLKESQSQKQKGEMGLPRAGGRGEGELVFNRT